MQYIFHRQVTGPLDMEPGDHAAFMRNIGP